MDADKAVTTNAVVQYAQPDQADLLRRANSRLVLAERFQIATPEQLALAVEEWNAVKKYAATLEATRKEITGPLDIAKKRVMDLFRAPLALLEKAETLYTDRIKAFRAEQARIAAEERAAAEATAEVERKRLSELAAVEQAAGNSATAAVLEQTAAMVVAPSVAKVTTAPGMSTREHWSFEIEDAALVPREFLIVDEKRIRAVVNGLKESAVIPGVRIFRDDVLASAKS